MVRGAQSVHPVLSRSGSSFRCSIISVPSNIKSWHVVVVVVKCFVFESDTGAAVDLRSKRQIKRTRLNAIIGSLRLNDLKVAAEAGRVSFPLKVNQGICANVVLFRETPDRVNSIERVYICRAEQIKELPGTTTI